MTIEFPPVFWVLNHKASGAQSGRLDEVIKHPPRPPFPSKPEMIEWSQSETTEHCFYNFAEPTMAGLRVAKDNPCLRIHGAIADYDMPTSDAEIALGLKRVSAEFQPAFISRTFSLGVRLLWIFEKPVPAMNVDVSCNFLEKVMRNVKATKILPGLDEPAFVDVTKYFELGTEWKPVNPVARIPESITTAWLLEAVKKSTFGGDTTSLPMDVIAAEVEKRWPGRWTSSFEPNATGPRFWDPKADHPRGCMVMDKGVLAFTGESRFLPWSEIFGADFVRRFSENRIGSAVKGVHFDGRGYWRKNVDGVIRDCNTDQINRFLAVDCGLGTEKDRKTGAPAESTVALRQIEELNRVDGAFPFLYDNHEVVTDRSGRYLNISRVKVTAPAEKSGEWGAEFPWIADYLDGLFDDEQRAVFLAWLSYFYGSAHAGKLRKGHGLFIAGPRGAGKTLLSSKVIGGLMGDSQEATDFILGETTFNKNLFHAPVWAVDDAIAAGDPRKHELYSSVVKKVIANFTLSYHPKFKDALTLGWLGRVIVTLNDDPDSIQMLPTIENSILDKVIFLLAKDPGISFKGCEETILRELPAFAAWLRDHKIPDHLVGDDRFGIREYHHPELLETARSVSSTSAAQDIIDMWKKEWFRIDPKQPYWEGNPSELLSLMQQTDGLKGLVDRTFRTANSVGINLRKLLKPHSIEFIRTKTKRVYRIYQHEAS